MALTQEQKNFISRLGAMAAADMQKTRILASLTMAQAILESGWGKSGLTVKANALFGIKAGTTWKGKVYSSKTQECYDGVNFVGITAAFRAYGSWEESVADHSALFTGAARYKAVVGEMDYKSACRAVHAAGYATDPQYAAKLIKVIEQYGLVKYDAPCVGGGSGMNENQLRTAVVSIATGFYGCKESDGSFKPIIDTYNANPPLARGYTMKYTDEWCACFVSVVAIKAGLLDIMPKEVSCEKMIELYKGKGRWQENDAYAPKPGDVIFYDWQDSGSGDNKGASDHVGIVVSVEGATIKVIEGNYTCTVNYRYITVNGKNIRGYGLPDYAKKAGEVSTPISTAQNFPANNASTAAPHAPVNVKKGDKVQFNGGSVYTSANVVTTATTKPASRCKVTQISSGKHPYHLISEDGKGVYGWVDAANVAAGAPAVFVPYKVKVNKGTSYRKGPGTDYAVVGTITDGGVYTITEEAEGTGVRWGKLLSGAGWVLLASIQKI